MQRNRAAATTGEKRKTPVQIASHERDAAVPSAEGIRPGAPSPRINGRPQKTLAIVSGVLTGVALGATIAAFILLRKQEQPAVSLVGGATFAIVGTF